MLGIVSDTDFEAELNKLKDKPTKIRTGRSSSDIPDALRKIIGENAILEGNKNTEELTNAFGVSRKSLECFKHGATDFTNYRNPKFRDFINGRKARITKRASSTLSAALNKIDDKKLDSCDAKELASVAKDMAVIIKNMEPEPIHEELNKRQPMVIFAPILLQEEKFEVIDLNEK